MKRGYRYEEIEQAAEKEKTRILTIAQRRPDKMKEPENWEDLVDAQQEALIEKFERARTFLLLREIFSTFNFPPLGEPGKERKTSFQNPVWLLLQSTTYDKLWEQVVLALGLPLVVGNAVTKPQIMRVLGKARTEELVSVFNATRVQLLEMGEPTPQSIADAELLFRELYFEYIRAYEHWPSSINFLTVFVHWLSLRETTGERFLISPEAALRHARAKMQVEPGHGSSSSSSSVSTEEKEEAHGGKRQKHDNGGSGRTVKQTQTKPVETPPFVVDERYVCVTRLDLIRDTTRDVKRFLFYQLTASPLELCFMVIGEPTSEKRVAVQGRLSRILKFFNGEFLYIYAVHEETAHSPLLVRVDVTDLEVRKLSRHVHIDAALYRDLIAVDAVANPYATRYCAAMKASRTAADFRILRLARLDHVPEPKEPARPLGAKEAERLRLLTLALHPDKVGKFEIDGKPVPKPDSKERKQLEDEYKELKRRKEGGSTPVFIPGASLESIRLDSTELIGPAPPPLFYDLPARNSRHELEGPMMAKSGQLLLRGCKLIALPVKLVTAQEWQAAGQFALVAFLGEHHDKQGKHNLVLKIYRCTLTQKGDFKAAGEPISIDLDPGLIRRGIDYDCEDFDLIYLPPQAEDDPRPLLFKVQMQITEYVPAEESSNLVGISSPSRYVVSTKFYYNDFSFNRAFITQLAPSPQLPPTPRHSDLMRLISDAGYWTVPFAGLAADNLYRKFDLLFCKDVSPLGTTSRCRLIFLRYITNIPVVYRVDLYDVQMHDIVAMTADWDVERGFLYIQVTREDRSRVVLRVIQDPTHQMHDYRDEEAEQLLYQAMHGLQLSESSLAQSSRVRSPRYCAMCGDETALTDNLSGLSYCDKLCQHLFCQTNRLLF